MSADVSLSTSLDWQAASRYSDARKYGGILMGLWSRRKFFLTSLAGGAVCWHGNLLGNVTCRNGRVARAGCARQETADYFERERIARAR